MASWTDFHPARLLARLTDGDVDFVVVGGVAVVLHAQPRFTKDLDVTYSTEAENLERLGAVLGGLHARLRGIDADVPFAADARTLRQVQILALTTDEGDLICWSTPRAPRPTPSCDAMPRSWMWGRPASASPRSSISPR